jgi:hypothetical protein
MWDSNGNSMHYVHVCIYTGKWLIGLWQIKGLLSKSNILPVWD